MKETANYFITVVGNGKNKNKAELLFLKKEFNGFSLIEKTSCWVGKNGWAKRSDKEGEDLTKKEGCKKEGDNRTPEGLFTLGRMFSHDIKKKTPEGKEPGANPNIYCYEDLNEVYECCIPGSPVGKKRNEPERMNNPLYKRAVFINYNYPKKNSSAGSCIFLHIGEKPTAGCVAGNFNIINKIFQAIIPNTTQILMLSSKKYLKDFPELKNLNEFV